MSKYQIVVEGVGRLIDQGSPGERLPSEQELCKAFGVSPMTVRRAIQILVDGGRAETVRGRGTYIAARRVLKSMSAESFSETMRNQGRVPGAEVLGVEMGLCTDVEAAELELQPDSKVVRVRRLRFGDHVPLGIEVAVLTLEQFPGLLGCDFTGSLYDLLRVKYQTAIERTRYRVRAVLPDADEVKWLQISPSLPCIETRTIGRNQAGVLVESTRSLFRGDQYELVTEFE